MRFGLGVRFHIDPHPLVVVVRAVGGPLRQAGAVRIAGLDEVYEISLHHFRYFVVGRLPGVALVQIEVAHGVLDFGGMGRAARTRGLLAPRPAAALPPRPVRFHPLLGGLARHPEVCRPGARVQIPVYRLPAGLHLKFGPLPRAVRYKACAGEMRGGFIHFIRRGGSISLHDVARFIAVELPDSAGERFRRGLAFAQHRPRRLLLGIRPGQQRYLGLLAGLEYRGQGLWQEIAV